VKVPATHRRPPKGRSMKDRTLGRTAIEDGDVALGGERQARL
jgi:hypothetical protein